MAENTTRRIRAVLRTLLAWGAAWGAAGGALSAVLTLVDRGPASASLPERVGMALLAGVSWGARFALVGAVVGTVFATAIGLRYRGRRLAEIDPVRFALLGAVVGSVGVPLFLQTMNVLTGDGPVAWRLLADDAVLCGVFGAIAAAASILLARRADRLAPGASPEELASPDDAEVLGAGAYREPSVAPRSHVARR